jgi:hypothetical protein
MNPGDSPSPFPSGTHGGENIFLQTGRDKLEVRLKKSSKNGRIRRNLLPGGRTTSILKTETQEKER